MLFQVSAIAILAVLYGFYLAKLILLNRQSVHTNQAGVGNKPKRVLLVERTMSVATVLTIVMEVGSIFLVKHPPITPIRIAGLLIQQYEFGKVGPIKHGQYSDGGNLEKHIVTSEKSRFAVT